jgi:2-keto-4-pentenoate hydratase/2-oxohepta-3-ene-1,7-dioic acid hydratase in catechol pathway
MTGQRPSKIVCVGRNYLEHAREMGNDMPKEPLIFLKPLELSSTAASRSCCRRNPSRWSSRERSACSSADGLRHASEADAVAAIAASVAVNDVTARDLQRSDSQWTRAKGFDTFCPVGKAAVASGHCRSSCRLEVVHAGERHAAAAGKSSGHGVLDPVPALVHLAHS